MRPHLNARACGFYSGDFAERPVIARLGGSPWSGGISIAACLPSNCAEWRPAAT